MRFRLAFAVDATGKVVNVGSTGYGSLISHETVHCICKCHVLRVYEIENRFQIIYRRRRIGEYLLGDSTAHVTTQNLYWITHRESNLLRRPFQRQSITVPGTQTSVLFLQKLPGVAQTSLFASASAPLAPPHLTSAFRRPCQSRGRPCAQRHQPPPQYLHLIYACVNFQLVNLGVRDARAFEISHVWPSAVGVGARDSASSIAPVSRACTVALIAGRRIR